MLFDFMNKLEFFFVGLAEKGLVPDTVIRTGIRQYLAKRIQECELDGNVETQQKYFEDIVADLKTRDIAEHTAKANDQHYEVPAELYLLMLGPYLKYSCGYWPEKNTILEESEVAMLELVCERAELDTLKSGDSVLDLGCGWGSCALFIGKKYPHLTVKCVSNSESQQLFIKKRAEEMGLKNVFPETCDINVMKFKEGSFDRIVSNEMFEHMKNYEKLLKNIHSWLKPTGKLFVHIFTHKDFTYHFQNGWMAETFFTGGTMPGKDLLLRFNKHMVVEKQWSVNGNHYSKTLEAWLKKLDDNSAEFTRICGDIYGKENTDKWVFNWRLFDISCSELFKFKGGNEWFVSHYLFAKQS